MSINPTDSPDPLVDQLEAASAEAGGILRRMAGFLGSFDPGRRWRTVEDEVDPDRRLDIGARIETALADCRPCPHLRRSAPQPAVATLALHRINCLRCCRTVRFPPVDEGDRCDWCGARGIVRFTPLQLQVGPLIVGGDACRACATALRLNRDSA